MKRAAPPPPSAAPICCPTCAEDLRAGPDSHAPLVLSPCGHSFCSLCVEVVLKGTEPRCPLCASPIAAAGPNGALGDLAEVSHARLAPTSRPCEDCAACDNPDFETMPVAVQCSVCEKGMCRDHGAVHKRHKSHDAAIIVAPFAESLGRCHVHPAYPVSLLCKTHNAVVCSECALGAHSADDYTKFADMGEELATRTHSLRAQCVEDRAVLVRATEAVQAAMAGMVARKDASLAQFKSHILALKVALDAHEAEVEKRVEALCASHVKQLEAQISSLPLSADQLAAAVGVCDTALSSGSPLRLARAAECAARMAGFVKQPLGPIVSTTLEVVCDTSPVLAAVAAMTAVRVLPVDPNLCVMDEVRVGGNAEGEEGNLRVTLSLKDWEGNSAEGVPPEALSLDVKQVNPRGVWPVSHHLVPRTLAGPGVWQLVFQLDEEIGSQMQLRALVYGDPVGQEVIVGAWCGRVASRVLNEVTPSVASKFVQELFGVWLPGRKVGELLYRGSVDGMTPAAFHTSCNNKGATVTLVRGNRCTFGAYADTAWTSAGVWDNSANTFLFTVENPFGIPPTRYPVRNTGQAKYSIASSGPHFGNGDLVLSAGAPASPFTNCYANLPCSYADTPGGKGSLTFAGAGSFVLQDVEVWTVVPVE